MKPAFSVLFFTVFAGAGTGLLVWSILIQLTTATYLGQALDSRLVLVSGATGLTVMTLGLLSSTLHLANPKNAWRAFSRFRSSWLSKEGVFSVLLYPVYIAYIFVLYSNDYVYTGWAAFFGVLSISIAMMTVYCTGMIYASLKPIRQWHNNLTTPLYLLFSLMSGAILTHALYGAMYQELSATLTKICISLLLITASLKWLYFWYIGKPKGETIATATGFEGQKVRLLDAGHSAHTFLTNEFIYQAKPETINRLRRSVAGLAFLMPLILLLMGNHVTVYLASLCMMLGLLIERWLFFAEAKHVVRLYHGDQYT